MSHIQHIQQSETSSEHLKKGRQSQIIQQPSKSLLNKFIKDNFIHAFLHNLKKSLVPREVPDIEQFESLGTEDEFENGIENDYPVISLVLFILLVSNYCQIFFQGLLLSYTAFRQSGYQLLPQLMFILTGGVGILVNMFVFREHNGTMLIKLKDIQKYYFQKYLIIDLVVLAMQILNCLISTPEINLIIFLLKFIQLNDTLNKFETSYITTEARESAWKLVYLFFLNVIIAQIIAIIFNAMLMINKTNNWAIKYKIDQEPWLNQYLYSIYWSVTTMMTVGYGDITPSNPQQSIIVAILELIGGITYAYNLNMIGNAINRFYADTEQLQNKMRLMRNFFRREKKKLNDVKLKNGILNSVRNNIFSHAARDIKAENQIIQDLDPKLCHSIMLKLRGSILNQVNFLNSLSREFKNKLVSAMKKQVFSNEELLTQAFKPNSRIYILERGIAKTMLEVFKDDFILEEYSSQDSTSHIFGLRTFISKAVEHFTVRCEGVCEFMAIDFNVLEQIISSNKQDRERLCYERDCSSRQQYNFETYCKVCKRSRHSLAFCPRHHYVPLKFFSNIKYKSQAQNSNPRFVRHRNRKQLIFESQVKVRRSIRRLTSVFMLEEERPREEFMDSSPLIKSKEAQELAQSGRDQAFEEVRSYKYYFEKHNVKKVTNSYNLHSSAIAKVNQLFRL